MRYKLVTSYPGGTTVWKTTFKSILAAVRAGRKHVLSAYPLGDGSVHVFDADEPGRDMIREDSKSAWTCRKWRMII